MYTNDICVYLGIDPDTHRMALQHALWHDVDEIFSGDFPGPNKRQMVKDRPAWDEGLRQFMTRVFGTMLRHRSGAICDTKTQALIKAIVKVADWLEAAVEEGTELQMGNQNVLVHWLHDQEECVKAIHHLGTLMPSGGSVVRHLEELIRFAIDEARYGQSPGPVMAEEMREALERRNRGFRARD